MTRPTLRLPPDKSGCCLEFNETKWGAVISDIWPEDQKEELCDNEWHIHMTPEEVAAFIKWWNEGEAK